MTNTMTTVKHNLNEVDIATLKAACECEQVSDAIDIVDSYYTDEEKNDIKKLLVNYHNELDTLRVRFILALSATL